MNDRSENLFGQNRSNREPGLCALALALIARIRGATMSRDVRDVKFLRHLEIKGDHGVRDLIPIRRSPIRGGQNDCV